MEEQLTTTTTISTSISTPEEQQESIEQQQFEAIRLQHALQQSKYKRATIIRQTARKFTGRPPPPKPSWPKPHYYCDYNSHERITTSLFTSQVEFSKDVVESLFLSNKEQKMRKLANLSSSPSSSESEYANSNSNGYVINNANNNNNNNVKNKLVHDVTTTTRVNEPLQPINITPSYKRIFYNGSIISTNNTHQYQNHYYPQQQMISNHNNNYASSQIPRAKRGRPKKIISTTMTTLPLPQNDLKDAKPTTATTINKNNVRSDLINYSNGHANKNKNIHSHKCSNNNPSCVLFAQLASNNKLIKSSKKKMKTQHHQIVKVQKTKNIKNYNNKIIKKILKTKTANTTATAITNSYKEKKKPNSKLGLLKRKNTITTAITTGAGEQVQKLITDDNVSISSSSLLDPPINVTSSSSINEDESIEEEVEIQLIYHHHSKSKSSNVNDKNNNISNHTDDVVKSSPSLIKKKQRRGSRQIKINGHDNNVNNLTNGLSLKKSIQKKSVKKDIKSGIELKKSQIELKTYLAKSNGTLSNKRSNSKQSILNGYKNLVTQLKRAGGLNGAFHHQQQQEHVSLGPEAPPASLPLPKSSLALQAPPIIKFLSSSDPIPILPSNKINTTSTTTLTNKNHKNKKSKQRRILQEFETKSESTTSTTVMNSHHDLQHLEPKEKTPEIPTTPPNPIQRKRILRSNSSYAWTPS